MRKQILIIRNSRESIICDKIRLSLELKEINKSFNNLEL